MKDFIDIGSNFPDMAAQKHPDDVHRDPRQSLFVFVEETARVERGLAIGTALERLTALRTGSHLVQAVDLLGFNGICVHDVILVQDCRVLHSHTLYLRLVVELRCQVSFGSGERKRGGSRARGCSISVRPTTDVDFKAGAPFDFVRPEINEKNLSKR